MKKVIFYGAGQNAYDNISKWIEKGYYPLCFVDIDPNKFMTKFIAKTQDGGVEVNITSLDKAIEEYPNSDIYITLKRFRLKEITEFLLNKGINKDRIKYFEDVEYRLGCNWLGTTYLIDDKIRTCCTPGYMNIGVKPEDNVEENYQRYCNYFINGILKQWKYGNADLCSGCMHLRYDVFDRIPVLQEINISSKSGEDYCNAKCVYCSKYPRPSLESMQKRKNEVVNALSFFSEKFPNRHFQIAISGGDISVSSFRKEVFDLLKRNDWTSCIMTNAIIYCEEISELLKMKKANVLITLDSTIPELYAKCKGVDSLFLAMKNIRRYAENGDVWIKWIALEGIYNSFDEICGIIDFASEIGASICVSCDTYRINERLSYKLLSLTLDFINYAKVLKINYRVMYDHFHKEDASYLKSMVE